jgi:hypothetical protein
MLKVDERFFRFNRAEFCRGQNLLHLFFWGYDNFEPEIPAHERRVMRQVEDFVEMPVEIEFDYEIIARAEDDAAARREKGQAALARLREYHENLVVAPQVDKTLPLTAPEWLFGTPARIRPVQIKYLRDSKELQVTGGTIQFLQKREYKRKNPEGIEITKNYYTFILDDGADRLQCVFFPNDNNRSKFEKLANRSLVIAVGVNDRQNDRQSFKITGISFAEQKKSPHER